MARSARKASLETRTARARLTLRRSPYFVKIAIGLRLGYYRGTAAGTWIARRYIGKRRYETAAIGLADDLTGADGVKIFDFWQAQQAAGQWAEKQRLVEAGMVKRGAYTVADAVRDYLEEIRAEKKPEAVRNAEYSFNAFVLPALSGVALEKLTTDRLVRWRNALATQPRRVRSKLTATEPATRAHAETEEARRRRRATANRILSGLKAALNRAFYGGRVASDAAWRKVKPFAKVDEAVVRYLSADEAQRLVNACQGEFRKLVQAALLTGCRYSELARLNVGDFNADSGTLSVRLSKGRARHVVLTAEAKTSFETWTLGKGSDEHVFKRDDGTLWSKSFQKRPLDEACKAARITAVTFHVLRHTHGSHLAMNGVPMGVIAAQLGHADTRMTEKHYAHLAPSYVAQAIRAGFPDLGIGDPTQVVALRRRAPAKQADAGNRAEARGQ